ncbi:TraB/GumN family protein [Ferruginibacter sp. SUN106]|uniref:TraB/GumN family protein n=1 Tax=Ferruginibacter sp. SUN106 TaxID=2978348 RepID=UPI003D36EBE7
MKTILLLISFFFSTLLYSQKTILWKISSKQTHKVSYLLGTNHLFGESFVNSFPVIKQKLLASDLIITETKMDRKAITASYNTRAASDSINLILSKEDVDYVAELFKKNNTIPISKFSPGELVIKLQTYYPRSRCSVFDPTDKFSMDEYVQTLGAKNGKQLHSFETDSFQMKMIATSFSKYNWDFARRNLPIILQQYRNPKTNEFACFRANQYASLDIDYKFQDTCNFLKGSIITNDEFIKKRNEAWLAQLPQLLENNNCFIAVGFGHLCNQCGLVKQIEALGYIVEPVTMK